MLHFASACNQFMHVDENTKQLPADRTKTRMACSRSHCDFETRWRIKSSSIAMLNGRSHAVSITCMVKNSACHTAVSYCSCETRGSLHFRDFSFVVGYFFLTPFTQDVEVLVNVAHCCRLESSHSIASNIKGFARKSARILCELGLSFCSLVLDKIAGG